MFFGHYIFSPDCANKVRVIFLNSQKRRLEKVESRFHRRDTDILLS